MDAGTRSIEHPARAIEQADKKKNFCVKSVAFVRDGVDVALSQGNSIKVFADAYLDYINFLVNQQVEIFKYESFCDNPDVTFRSIGESLEIHRKKFLMTIVMEKLLFLYLSK